MVVVVEVERERESYFRWLDESLEKVEFETNIVVGSDGGSIVKISVKYHTKGDAVLSDAVREETKAKGTGLIKAIEGYVLANPNY